MAPRRHWAGALHVGVRPDGRVVLGTHGHAGSRLAGFALVRLQRNGSLDRGFGNGGIAVSNVGYGVHALALDRRGRIVTAGRTMSLQDFVVARFLPDGRDCSFVATVTDFRGVDTPFWLVLQPDGKVVVVWGVRLFWHRLPPYPEVVSAWEIYDAVLNHDVRTLDELDAYLDAVGLPTATRGRG